MEKTAFINKVFRSLILLTFAWTQSFSAYYALEGLQSSVNPTTGLISLSLIYGFYFLSSMLLPAYVSRKFKPYQILPCCQLLYALYTAANYYPTAWTLFPSAVIMGIAGGPFWATARVYVASLAKVHATCSAEELPKVSARYFGIFYMMQASQVIGNALMWLINETAKEINLDTFSNNLTTLEYIEPNQNDSNCGIFHTNTETEKGSHNDLDSGNINYLAISIFLAMQVFSAVLFYFLYDTTSFKEPNNEDNKLKDNYTSFLSVELDKFDNTSLQTEEVNNNTNLLDRNKERNELNQVSENDSAKKAPSMLQAMFNLVKSDKTCILMLMLTFHTGFLHSTFVGDFTKSWVSCAKGVSYVPTLLMMYGAISTVASFSIGFIVKLISVTYLIYFSLLVEVLMFVTLTFWWIPMSNDPIWYFLLYSAGFGMCIGLGRSLVAQVYSQLYFDNTAAGMALLGSGEAISSCVMFSLGDMTPPIVKIMLTLCFAVFGSLLYHVAWNLKDSQKRYYKVK